MHEHQVRLASNARCRKNRKKTRGRIIHNWKKRQFRGETKPSRHRFRPSEQIDVPLCKLRLSEVKHLELLLRTYHRQPARTHAMEGPNIQEYKVFEMKISVKQLNGTVLKVDAEGSDTILVLKGNVAAQNADLAVELQKLIYKGKVLKDAQTVGELEFNEENDYMVCMMSKAKAAKPAAGGAAPAAVGASSTGAAPAASTAAATPAAAVSTPAAAAAPALAPAAAPQNFATPEAIANLQAFSGAGPEEATAALNAAMGNADLAFEFLQTGIPDAVPGTPPAGQGLALDALPAPPAGGGGGGLQALRAHPQFNALRQAVQQNPQVLPQILQAIGQQVR